MLQYSELVQVLQKQSYTASQRYPEPDEHAVLIRWLVSSHLTSFVEGREFFLNHSMFNWSPCAAGVGSIVAPRRAAHRRATAIDICLPTAAYLTTIYFSLKPSCRLFFHPLDAHVELRLARLPDRIPRAEETAAEREQRTGAAVPQELGHLCCELVPID